MRRFTVVNEELEFVQVERPSTRALFLFVIGLIAGLWFVAYVWPTGYLYDHHHGALIRIERGGGPVDLLTQSGWLRLDSLTVSADSSR